MYFADDDGTNDVSTLSEGDAITFDVSAGLLLFDGRRAHGVADFGGERFSLVFYPCPLSERLPPGQRQRLYAAGFPPLPEQPEAAPPRACERFWPHVGVTGWIRNEVRARLRHAGPPLLRVMT